MVIDSYDSPEAEALLQAGKQGGRARAVVTEVTAATSFLVAAGLLAGLASWHRTLSITNVLLVVALYVIVERVKFPVTTGWAYPTMLAFVPMLFLLPTPVVPLFAAAAILLGGTPGYLRGRTPVTRVPAHVADAWFSMGPALVIVLGGAQHFGWSHWPVYVGALAAQLLFDLTASTLVPWIAEGLDPRPNLPLMAWVYVLDASLAPLGLMIAAVTVQRPGLLLLTLPFVAVFVLFARERQQRLDAILELSTAYRGTTLLLCEIIDADDQYTGMHSRDVVDLSVAVADVLALDATSRRNVEFSALLHDVGKVRVPKEIINKPGKLDASEWEIMRRHTIEGEALLRQVGGRIASIGRIVRASHERWDGAGYPDGLIREQIPIEARIVAACDAYSAMTTDRPYREAMDPRGALTELRREAGKQFDPRVVLALEGCIEAELLVADDRPEDTLRAAAIADSSGHAGGAGIPEAGAILTASRGCSSVG